MLPMHSGLHALASSWKFLVRPVRSLRRAMPLTSTLPVRLFFWTAAAIAVLFLGSWYLASYPCSINVSHDCSL